MRRYAAARVQRVDTQWPEGYAEGRAAWSKGDAAAAAAHFRRAATQEPRLWAARQILAEVARCQAAVGELAPAARTCLAVLQSDPSYPIYDRLPLAWLPGDAVPTALSQRWLSQQELPAAMLLGASFRLHGQESAAALYALQQLSSHEVPEIAALAEAQLWRRRILTATADDVAAWQQRVDTFPAGVRAGPYFLLGRAWEQLGQADAAALAYLRLPIHFKQQRRITAQALLSAGQILQQQGDKDAARRLWQELAGQFADTAEAAEAQRLLRTRQEHETP